MHRFSFTSMLQQKIVTAALVVIGMFTASGWTSKAQSGQSTTGQGQSTTEPNQNALSASDRQFVTSAAQGGIAEVQLGQLASRRAASNEVKQFGQRMVRDHTQKNNQLKQLAAQKGITLPKDMGDQNKAVMANLKKLSGADLDRAYTNHMLQDHIKDVSLFQREAKEGQDQDLKAWAAKTLPTLQEHLRLVRSITGNTAGTTSH